MLMVEYLRGRAIGRKLQLFTVACGGVTDVALSVVKDLPSREAESRFVADLLRDIFGPLPFRAVAVNPSWLGWNDGTIPRLAQGIYEDRRFGDLPILADALEDSGCSDPDILGHCRSGGDHVRGCWVVDLVLAKG
jgi:hypothetical protein